MNRSDSEWAFQKFITEEVDKKGEDEEEAETREDLDKNGVTSKATSKGEGDAPVGFPSFLNGQNMSGAQVRPSTIGSSPDTSEEDELEEDELEEDELEDDELEAKIAQLHVEIATLKAEIQTKIAMAILVEELFKRMSSSNYVLTQILREGTQYLRLLQTILYLHKAFNGGKN
ncbi:hypothetical protein F3Y22_tig00112402pilonHSYRG00018 [Hibiscus syriacus]|uniref:Uncharacterized protein n=1 Tax=Hibiscus syriacus TaxID=106335 RepID=A0A6A2Y4T5_HIBSY|nr:hypothetical protein F3Y22_tig00112402pilonHSYRG00018 [Hibiscus syriacus]